MEYTPTIRIFKSIFENLSNLISEHLYIPFFITLICFCVWVMVLLRKNAFSKKVLERMASRLLLIFYISFVLEITIISRIGLHYYPFENVLGGWSIFHTEYYMYIDFSPIVNILMFIPLAPLLYLCFHRWLKLDLKLLQNVTAISFGASAFIELTQLIFGIGTFQLSDLVLNTLSGAISAGILFLAKTIYKKVKKKK